MQENYFYLQKTFRNYITNKNNKRFFLAYMLSAILKHKFSFLAYYRITN